MSSTGRPTIRQELEKVRRFDLLPKARNVKLQELESPRRIGLRVFAF
jgi:hypothetical protein